MTHKVLVIVAATLVVAAAVPFTSGCGAGDAAPEPAPSATQPARLLVLEEFALLEARPMRVALHVSTSQRLRLGVLTEHDLRSYVLERIADAEGAPVTPTEVPLELGAPPSTAFGTPYVLLTKQPVEPGYYRLELRGEGRVLSRIADSGK